MSRLDEQLTEQFYLWELRGRGWQVFDGPVYPEPPFCPFYSHYLPQTPAIDDGRKPTLLASLVRTLSQMIGTEPPPAPPIPEEDEEPEPEPLVRDPLIEFSTYLPSSLNIRREEFEQFLLALSLCREPVTFELVGTFSNITVQFAIHPNDESLVREQLHAYFPDVVFLPRSGTLEQAWENVAATESAIVEFGLAKEFMFTLGSGRLDPFVGITGALSALQPEEIGLFQVIFHPARKPWAESIIRSVTDNENKPFFVNAPELFKEAMVKTSRPLYAVVIRMAAKSEYRDRTWDIARNLTSTLGVFARPNGNELIPLANDEYPPVAHEKDLLRRQSRRSGMLLNSEELIGFVHLPSVEVRSPKLARQTLKTKPVPQAVVNPKGLVLGDNVHAGVRTSVALTPEQRVRHMHIIGGSGTGKSTLLFNLIRQDIEEGAGVAVLDPHGDLVDRLLGVIPQGRINDVVLVDPSDEEFSVGFNILSAHSDLEKNLLASDLVSVFQRLSTSWGDQMGSVLNNAILAFLESRQGGTLADLRRFLIEPEFRERFLETVEDPEIVYYWKKGFAQLTGNKSIGPVLTRLETFLSPKPIRYMVSQSKNRLDFARIMDSGGIFLAKLSQGLLGKENSFLLGSLIVSKFQQLAMARQRQAVATRRDFTVFIDEFHNFITPSMAEILAGARKYRIGLVLAHQELRQLQRDAEVGSAVLSNSGTRICFRVGDDDARKLSDGFSFFEARDLQNLGIGQAICRVERSDFDFNIEVPLPQEPNQAETAERRNQVIAASRMRYGTPRKEIEASMYAHMEPAEKEPKIPAVRPKQPERDLAPIKEVEPIPQPQEKPSVEAKKQETPEPELALEQEVQQKPPPLPLPEPKLNVKSNVPTLVEPSQQVPEPRPSSMPADLGRGGAQHQAIQLRLKGVAQGLGFKSTIEKQILDGQGSIDLLLERESVTVACEISVTTTVDHEVGNVRKCLKAGFPNIVVCSSLETHLRKIEVAVRNSMGPEVSGKVSFFLPDDFIQHLQTLVVANAEPAPIEEKKRLGYKIKRSYVEISPEEAKARQEVAVKLLAEKVKRKRSVK